MKPQAAIIGAIATAQASAHVPDTVSGLIDMLTGGSPSRRDLGRAKAQIAQEIAQETAGTTDKQSKEYKAALRNVQRWYNQETGTDKQRQRPSAEKKSILERVAQRLAQNQVKNQMRKEGASVKAEGDVKVSNDERYRDIPMISLTPADMAVILDALDSGQYDDMEEAFDDAFFHRYPIGRNATFTNIHELDITAGLADDVTFYAED